MLEFIQTAVIPSCILLFLTAVFLGGYRLFDVPKLLFRDVLEIKSEWLLCLLIVAIPFGIGWSLSCFMTWNIQLFQVQLNMMVALTLACMISLMYRFIKSTLI